MLQEYGMIMFGFAFRTGIGEKSTTRVEILAEIPALQAESLPLEGSSSHPAQILARRRKTWTGYLTLLLT